MVRNTEDIPIVSIEDKLPDLKLRWGQKQMIQDEVKRKEQDDVKDDVKRKEQDDVASKTTHDQADSTEELNQATIPFNDVEKSTSSDYSSLVASVENFLLSATQDKFSFRDVVKHLETKHETSISKPFKKRIRSHLVDFVAKQNSTDFRSLIASVESFFLGAHQGKVTFRDVVKHLEAKHEAFMSKSFKKRIRWHLIGLIVKKNPSNYDVEKSSSSDFNSLIASIQFFLLSLSGYQIRVTYRDVVKHLEAKHEMTISRPLNKRIQSYLANLIGESSINSNINGSKTKDKENCSILHLVDLIAKKMKEDKIGDAISNNGDATMDSRRSDGDAEKVGVNSKGGEGERYKSNETLIMTTNNCQPVIPIFAAQMTKDAIEYLCHRIILIDNNEDRKWNNRKDMWHTLQAFFNLNPKNKDDKNLAIRYALAELSMNIDINDNAYDFMIENDKSGGENAGKELEYGSDLSADPQQFVTQPSLQKTTVGKYEYSPGPKNNKDCNNIHSSPFHTKATLVEYIPLMQWDNKKWDNIKSKLIQLYSMLSAEKSRNAFKGNRYTNILDCIEANKVFGSFRYELEQQIHLFSSDINTDKDEIGEIQWQQQLDIDKSLLQEFRTRISSIEDPIIRIIMREFFTNSKGGRDYEDVVKNDSVKSLSGLWPILRLEKSPFNLNIFQKRLVMLMMHWYNNLIMENNVPVLVSLGYGNSGKKYNIEKDSEDYSFSNIKDNNDTGDNKSNTDADAAATKIPAPKQQKREQHVVKDAKVLNEISNNVNDNKFSVNDDDGERKPAAKSISNKNTDTNASVDGTSSRWQHGSDPIDKLRQARNKMENKQRKAPLEQICSIAENAAKVSALLTLPPQNSRCSTTSKAVTNSSALPKLPIAVVPRKRKRVTNDVKKMYGDQKSAHRILFDDSDEDICGNFLEDPPTQQKNSTGSSQSSKNSSSKGKRRKFFSLGEKNAIREGVRLFGVGKWKDIKCNYDIILATRTTIQIKDCYRTLLRRGEDVFTPQEKNAVQEGLRLFGVGKWREIKCHFFILENITTIQIEECYHLLGRSGKLSKQDQLVTT